MWRRKQDKQAAVEALTRSSAQLEIIQAREPEVSLLALTMRRYGEANHFAERLNMHVKRGNP